jgi:hypothetical protein
MGVGSGFERAGEPTYLVLLIAHLNNSGGERRHITPVPVDENNSARPVRQRPHQFYHLNAKCFVADRHRPRETLMLSARTVCDCRRDQGMDIVIGKDRRDPFGGRHGDHGVGVQRQVRAVLLRRPNRD